MAKVGVVLSGCGFLDGAEIRESVLTLLALERAGVDYECLAPDVEQMHVVDHTCGTPTEGESRNVLREAARIARGEIRPTADVDPAELSGLVLPGGYGAAKNLSDFATQGAACEVEESVARLVRGVHDAGKPVGFICIAPAIAAKLLPGVKLTIGSDAATAATLEDMGAKHVECAVDDFVEDEEQKVLSCPAYMVDAGLPEIAEGIDRLVRRLAQMVV